MKCVYMMKRTKMDQSFDAELNTFACDANEKVEI